MRITPWLRVVGSRQFGLSSPFDCHMYALRQPGAGIVLIDAGSGMGQARVIENLREEFDGELDRGVILLTHRHPDHACGAARLSQALRWPVVTSAWSRPVIESGDTMGSGLVEAQLQGAYPPEMRMEPCSVARAFDDGEYLSLEGWDLQPIRIRGHSDDSVAFLFTQNGRRCLIAGDIVFYGGVLGVINTPDSSLRAYRDDLPKLAGQGIDALLPGHGLFTLEGGQAHIDAALREVSKGFVPRTIGQGDLIF